VTPRHDRDGVSWRRIIRAAACVATGRGDRRISGLRTDLNDTLREMIQAYNYLQQAGLV
jgi:hypothetical protein